MGLDIPGSGIPLGFSTIANKLKGAGYATHAVGKWHCGFATAEQTPLGRGFDSYFGYFGGFNDYIHAWSEQACAEQPSTNHNVTYDNATADRTKCTSASVHLRHLRSTTDLWEDSHPAHGLNGSGFEEAQFAERVLGIC
jgi:arylsulfatase B